jgi:hypothetical protein
MRKSKSNSAIADSATAQRMSRTAVLSDVESEDIDRLSKNVARPNGFDSLNRSLFFFP